MQKSTSIPTLDQRCGRYLKFRDLIHCGETQSRLGIPNLPLNPETYNALYSLSTQVLDPVIDYFGAVRLTYGFCSPTLGAKACVSNKTGAMYLAKSSTCPSGQTLTSISGNSIDVGAIASLATPSVVSIQEQLYNGTGTGSGSGTGSTTGGTGSGTGLGSVMSATALVNITSRDNSTTATGTVGGIILYYVTDPYAGQQNV